MLNVPLLYVVVQSMKQQYCMLGQFTDVFHLKKHFPTCKAYNWFHLFLTNSISASWRVFGYFLR